MIQSDRPSPTPVKFFLPRTSRKTFQRRGRHTHTHSLIGRVTGTEVAVTVTRQPGRSGGQVCGAQTAKHGVGGRRPELVVVSDNDCAYPPLFGDTPPLNVSRERKDATAPEKRPSHPRLVAVSSRVRPTSVFVGSRPRRAWDETEQQWGGETTFWYVPVFLFSFLSQSSGYFFFFRYSSDRAPRRTASPPIRSCRRRRRGGVCVWGIII